MLELESSARDERLITSRKKEERTGEVVTAQVCGACVQKSIKHPLSFALQECSRRF